MNNPLRPVQARSPCSSSGFRPTAFRLRRRFAVLLAVCTIALTLQKVHAQDQDQDKPIQFSAQDSLVLTFSPEGDTASLIGSARVQYGEATLEAHEIQILFEQNELHAVGAQTEEGLVGPPQFRRGSEEFQGTELAFSLRSERGRVVGARTAMDEGFISGEVVKVASDSTLYISDGAYTTCACVDDPSYSLRADRMKVVEEKWVYTGPIQLFLFNIPTPLWLPFGFLPAQEGRRSGPLPPRYGEDERGFYLRDWGWYWAMNEYMDLQLQLGLWTRGSWQVAPLYRYNKRYRYSGQLGIDYVRNRRGEQGDPDLTIINTSSLRWQHQQTLSPTSTLNSNVNLSSSSYLRAISEQYDDRVRQTVESTVRFNKRWPTSSRSLSLDLSQRQILATGDATLNFPTLSFSQGSRKPFQRGRRAGRSEAWFERITYSYNGTLSNRYDFRRLPGDSAAAEISWYDALFRPSLYRRATGNDQPIDFRTSHSVPVSASFGMNRLPVINRIMRLNFNTSLSYTEDWFIRTIRQEFDPDSGVVVTNSVPGFFALRKFSSSLSANTTFYGLFPFRLGRLTGLRHTVRPTASLSYSPDFNAGGWGYTRTYENATGEEVQYAIVRNAALGREQRTLSFSLANVFETKLAPSGNDTTASPQPQTLKLLDLDVSSSYNFAADSLKLADIRISSRTSLFNRIHLNLSSNLSPYALNAENTRPINEFIFSPRNFRIARLTRLDLSARGSFRSRTASVGRPATASYAQDVGFAGMEGLPGSPLPYDPVNAFGAGVTNTAVGYADFAIPWSLDLSFTYSLSRPFVDLTKRAIMNAGFDFNLTPNWKVQGRSGYDLVLSEIVSTDLSIFRDFECWQMSFRWVPFGRYQSYSFDLHVKSGKLRDLLRIRQPRSDVRGRFTGLLN